MTDRELNDTDPEAPPQASPEQAQGEAAEPNVGEKTTPVPPPSPPPLPWEREQPAAPGPAGQYRGHAGGNSSPPGDRQGFPAGAHRGEPPAERAAAQSEPRTGPQPAPTRDDLTQVYSRESFGPPPLPDEPTAATGERRPASRPPRQPGPGPEGPAPQRAGETAPHRGGGQWGDPPLQRGEGVPPPRQSDPGRWPDRQPRTSAPAASPGDWSYVDGIRSSELVPTRKLPPRRGWRRAMYKGTFGLINLGMSPDERRLAELEAKIRSLLRGRYKIGVLGKGGTGKTTIAAGVGSVFAELRQDDRVVAIDADTSFGKLGSRIDPNVKGSYWELAADDQLYTFADVRSRVGNNAAGLFVLAGESATARRRVIGPAIYREATARLDNHFTISVVDCGSTMDAEVTQEVLRDLDALIVVSSPWVDGASAAGQTMEWLANNGYTGLLHRTVVLLNDSDGHADKRTRNVLVEQFSSRGQTVIELPYDPHLRPGGVIDIQSDVAKTTRRRLIEAAAAIAEHFPTTTDAPRGRR